MFDEMISIVWGLRCNDWAPVLVTLVAGINNIHETPTYRP